MSYYILPHISNKLDVNDIKLTITNSNENNNICKTSYFYLSSLKREIENHIDKWDIYKKYTNTYEYIHSQIPIGKTSVCKYKPLSRSYFKFIEISNIFDLLNYMYYQNIESFHLCEGPGGFIEAISNLRNNQNDKYYGMTLINNDENTPGWKKSNKFLKNNPNVFIEAGKDNTGNILNPENYSYCVEKYLNRFHIITGDGGFDFSINFNNQENICNRLILAQILYAITIQKYKGSFILKIFDIFSKSTIDYIYLLSLFYDKVFIFKPQTSRLANSEKYIICKNFKFITSKSYVSKFHEILKTAETITEERYISSFFSFRLPYFYITKIEEISNVLCQFQINVINNTIILIKNNEIDNKVKIEELIRANVSKCIQWCTKNNIAFNKYCLK
jgi:23S rRNA U2552 (ribose-2'-O)-methylase RlmE/FtsJ